MFFTQLLCLLYLMPLPNAYTISNTTNKEVSQNNYETIKDVDYPDSNTYVKPLKYRNENIDYPERIYRHAKFRKYRKENDSTEFISTTVRSLKHHKTTKRRSGGLWHKNKNKGKFKTTTVAFHNYDSENLVFDDKSNMDSKRRSKKDVNNKANRKGEHTQDTSTESGNNNKTSMLTRKEIDLTQYHKFMDSVSKTMAGHKIERPTMENSENNLRNLIEKITSKVTDLKKLYSDDKYRTDQSSVKVYITEPTQPTTKNPIDNEILCTDQIETLLNDIKERQIQMISEINPSLSTLITNTVTEATYTANPILKHIDKEAPSYFLSTFVTINDVHDKIMINSADVTTNETETNTLAPHKINLRSLSEDGITLAYNIEDYLQKELKHLYKKVKNTVGKDFTKEIKQAKSTLKKETCKMTKKIMDATKSTTKTYTMNVTKTIGGKAVVTRQNRSDTHTKNNNVTHAQSSIAMDDYVLLTLYEQILAKTHADNVMKIKTSPTPFQRKKRKKDLISKSNSETLRDLNLIKIYDDGVIVPDVYDFTPDISIPDMMSPESNYFSTNLYNKSLTTHTDQVEEAMSDLKTNEPTNKDSDFESLTTKMAFKDYVDGYKYYLKFQKGEAKTNFSNLVRYQAHRHHNVDDIGKFILNKIPQIPTGIRQKRAKNKIFDDNDFDDQEVSTKTDDSWFKKHFYMFIDSGPPKKFHTSQTVSFKDPKGEIVARGKEELPSTNKGVEERNLDNINLNKQEESEVGPDDYLDDLSKDLEIKLSSAQNIVMKSDPTLESVTLSSPKVAEKDFQNFPVFKEIQQNIAKFFAKSRRLQDSKDNRLVGDNNYIKTDKVADVEENDDMDENFDDFEMIDNFRQANTNDETDFIFDRSKRHTKKHAKHYEKVKDGKISTACNNTANNKKEYGFVDIDLVPNQKETQNDIERSKFKKMLNIFHKDKKKIHKRNNHESSKRMQRFNPLEKLKNIFRLSKLDQNPFDKNVAASTINDYDMLITNLPSFRPVKFGRIPSIEQMRKQIPNITDDIDSKARLNEIMRNYGKPKAMTTEQVVTLYEYDQNDETRRSLEPFFIASMENFVTSTESTSESTATLKRNPKIITTTPSTTSYSFKDYTYDDNLLSVNIVKTLLTPSTEIVSKKAPSHIKYEDLRKEIKKLNNKVTPRDGDNKFNDNVTNNKGINDYSMPKTTLYTMTKHTPTTLKENEFDFIKSPRDKSIIFGTKQTRIAKFRFKQKPKNNDLEHIVPVLESPQIYEYVDKFNTLNNFKERRENMKTDKYSDLKVTNNVHESSFSNTDVTKPSNEKKCFADFVRVVSLPPAPKYYASNSHKPYPDYFSDLLLWHQDILNNDKVPSWQDIIHSNINTEYNPPDLQNIRQELRDMEDNFTDNNPEENIVSKYYEMPASDINLISSVADDNTFLNTPLRTVAMNDDTIGQSQDITIKGESKYYKFDREPCTIAGTYVKTVDNISNLDSKAIFPIKRKDEEVNDDTKSKNEGNLVVDPTLFSYDDDMDYVTPEFEKKKLTKNSLNHLEHNNVRAEHSQIKPLAKINKPPQQYFSTPLPMQKRTFEKFLKDNQLDVASVTKPLSELPELKTKKPLEEYHDKKPKINFHRDDITSTVKVLDKKTDNFDSRVRSNESAESTKATKLEEIDLDSLHRDLFYDFNGLIVKRDINSGNSDVTRDSKDGDRYIDSIKLFDIDNFEDNDKVLEINEIAVADDPVMRGLTTNNVGDIEATKDLLKELVTNSWVATEAYNNSTTETTYHVDNIN